MAHVYGHERDDKGDVIPRTVGAGGLSDEERMRKRWREDYYLTEEQVEVKWAEFLAWNAYEAHLEGQPGLSAAERMRLLEEYRAGQLRRR